MKISSAESRLGSLDSIVCSEKMLCEGELYCLEHRRKISGLCLLYKTYCSVDHPLNKCLNTFVAAHYT